MKPVWVLEYENRGMDEIIHIDCFPSQQKALAHANDREQHRSACLEFKEYTRSGSIYSVIAIDDNGRFDTGDQYRLSIGVL